MTNDGTVLNVYIKSSHLILTTKKSEVRYCHPYFTDEKIEAERLRDLPRLMHLVEMKFEFRCTWVVAIVLSC